MQLFFVWRYALNDWIKVDIWWQVHYDLIIMATPKKLVEAERLVAEGERYLKTHIFKWRSDYDSAAPCFEKAAITYKNFKQPEKALKLYLKVAECHYKNSARFHAGKIFYVYVVLAINARKKDNFIFLCNGHISVWTWSVYEDDYKIIFMSCQYSEVNQAMTDIETQSS